MRPQMQIAAFFILFAARCDLYLSPQIKQEYPPTHFYPNDHLEQNHLIRSYVQSIIAALESENSMLLTNRYQKLKAYELFHLLFSLYDKSSLVNFFAKLLDYKTDFREFLFQNCDRVKSVNELIQLSGLSEPSSIVVLTARWAFRFIVGYSFKKHVPYVMPLPSRK